MTDTNMPTVDMGDVYSSDANIIPYESTLSSQSYITNFDIMSGEDLTLSIATGVNLSTSYDLVTLGVGSTLTVKDALIGYFNSNNQLSGYYNVDWNTTSLWQEMTNFQNGTVKRFFGIWGYFAPNTSPQKVLINGAPTETYIINGKSIDVNQYTDSGFIDPADASSWEIENITYTQYQDAINHAGVIRQLCGSLLKPEDIRTYYRIPRYEVIGSTTTTANSWQLNRYDKPTIAETQALLKRVFESSITETMYDAVRMQEVLPIEMYQDSTNTTSIMSQSAIAALFRNNYTNGDITVDSGGWASTSEGINVLLKFPTN